MISIESIALAITVFLNIILAIAVLSKSDRSRSTHFFLGLIASILLWSISLLLFSALNKSDTDTLLALSKVSYLGACLSSLFLFDFSLFYQTQKVKTGLFRQVIVENIVICGFVLYAILSNHIVTGVLFKSTETILKFGSWYNLYFLIIFINFCASTILLVQKHRNSSDVTHKRQLEIVVSGIFLTLLGGAFTNLILPTFGVSNFYWLGPVFTLIHIVAISIAIIRYHLFEVRIIATEIVVFGLWIFIFGRTLLSVSLSEAAINGSLLLITIIVGYLLIRSVRLEVESRERIEALAQELEHANIQLTEFDRQKSEFVSIASHQLRSPLTAIKGCASMLLEGSFGELPEKMREPIDRIFMSSDTLVLVIENFLNISRIEQGRMNYTMEPIDLAELAKGAVGQLAPNAMKREIAIDFKAEGIGPFIANVDKEKIRQCFLNFIDNSIKYTKTGSINVTLSRTDDRLRFMVTDTGIGMTPDTLARLFQKFSRALDASKTNAVGAGLGLFLVAEIIKAHNGKVFAESDGPGKGSRFIIELAAA